MALRWPEPIPTLQKEVQQHGWRRVIFMHLDELVTRVTAGIPLTEVRNILRGEPPPRPNPRVKPHTEGFILHIKPSFYHEAVTRLYPTFRLGLLSFYLFLIETITGIFLMIFYTPSPLVAYENMLRILNNVPFGQLMRDIHRLGAEAMVVAVMLHMLRTFFTASYKRPRQFTWATGVILLVFTLFLSFSGYLLPWDQLSYWAVTIGTSMAEATPPPALGRIVNLILRGAPDIGAAGLLRFYLLHVIFLPLLLFFVFFVHYYKVVRHGLSLPPEMEAVGDDTARKVPPEKRVPYIPDIAIQEALWGIGLIAFLVIGAAFFYDAPLEQHADPLNTPLHTTAPWYFLWLQGLLKDPFLLALERLGLPRPPSAIYNSKVIMGVILPGLILFFLLIMPYLDFNISRRYSHRRKALVAGLVGVAAWTLLTYMGTPAFAVTSSADVEVMQEFIPLNPDPLFGEGKVRTIPYEQLVPGTYDTRNLQLPADAPRLARVLEDMKRRIETDPHLPQGYAIVRISEVQANLKRFEIALYWLKLDEHHQPVLDEQGNPVFQETKQAIYLHRDSTHGE